ncbi:MAG: AI-2E family transporter [Clostridia bacterium]|nr:AI-2E family transporter [Clostridia bacterium]
MKKLNTKYFTIAVYALAVLAVSIVFLLFCINLGAITEAFGSFLSAIGSILYAILFAFLLLPAVKRLEPLFDKLFSKKKPHPHLASGFAIGVTYVLALGIAALIVIVIVPLLIDDINALTSFLAVQKDRLDAFVEANRAQNAMLADLYDSVMDFFFGEGEGGFFSSALGSAIASAGTLLSIVFSQASNIFLGLILSIYLLASRRVLSSVIGKLVVAFIPKERTTGFVMFFKRLYTDFCAFAFNRLVVTLFFSVITFLICSLLGVRLRSVVVLLVLLSHLIPVIGPIVGTTLAIILVFLLSAGWKGFVFAAVVLTLEILCTNLVLPHLLPSKLRPPFALTAVLVLLCMSLFGVIGAFVAVPLYATIAAETRRFIIHRLAKKKLPVSAQAYEDFDLNDMKTAEEAVRREAEAAIREDKDEDEEE